MHNRTMPRLGKCDKEMLASVDRAQNNRAFLIGSRDALRYGLFDLLYNLPKTQLLERGIHWQCAYGPNRYNTCSHQFLK